MNLRLISEEFSQLAIPCKRLIICEVFFLFFFLTMSHVYGSLGGKDFKHLDKWMSSTFISAHKLVVVQSMAATLLFGFVCVCV